MRRAGSSFSTRLSSRRWRLLALAACAVASGSAAAGPVLHEFIDLGPGDGPVEPHVTSDGLPQPAGEPAAGGAPGSSPNPGAAALDLAGAGAIADPGSTFSIDRDTTRPESVSYEDPFTPTIVPYKRGVVYDGVNRDADLVVSSSALVSVDKLARSGPHDEHFHAALTLELRAGTPLPIPSVAPGSRLVLAHGEPRVPLRIAVDSAENWFLESNRDAKVELNLQVVADRRVFGSAFADPSTAELARALPPVPRPIESAAREVGEMLGIPTGARPRQAVTRLTDHFRRFRPSERRPAGRGVALYRELALSGRGICRHRAYAFTVTALGLGIPSRMAMNEAHAWVEVFDGQLWHRIDLGGAAEELEASDAGRPRHVEPRDPFAWPSGEESGRVLAANRSQRALAGEPPPGSAEAGGPQTPARPPLQEPLGAPREPRREPAEAPRVPAEPAPDDAEEPGEAPSSAPEPPEPATPPEPAPVRPGSVVLSVGTATAQRGKGVPVSGSVQHEGQPCSGARVDITLRGAAGDAVPLGTLVTDPQGRFRGQLVIPWDAKLGAHSLMAEAAGPCAHR